MEYAGSRKALKSTSGPDFLGGRRDLIKDKESSRVASMMKAMVRTAHPKPISEMSLRKTIGYIIPPRNNYVRADHCQGRGHEERYTYATASRCNTNRRRPARGEISPYNRYAGDEGCTRTKTSNNTLSQDELPVLVAD